VKDLTQGDASTHKNKVRVHHTEEELYAFELIGFRSKLRNRLAGNF
jgi:hypothetical protein